MISLFDGWSLLDPWFLAGIPLMLLAVFGRRPRTFTMIPDLVMAKDLPSTLRQRLAWLPRGIKVLAGIALLVALARPVTREVVPVRSQGIDILLVLDVSSSMRMEDVGRVKSRSRIAAVREKAIEFAEARTNDRVGLVTFAKFSDLRCPLTLDKEGLSAFLRGLETVPPNTFEDGTQIGTGLAKAVRILEEGEGESRIVVLLSDGENNVPADIEWEDAAKLAKDAGVKCYTIGFGRGRPHPFGGFEPLSFTALKGIADGAEGQFFEAKDESRLADVYAEIDRLETRELEDPRYRTEDWFEWPLAIGAVLLLLALLLEFLWIREAPA